jgi:hypothetical protein
MENIKISASFDSMAVSGLYSDIITENEFYTLFIKGNGKNSVYVDYLLGPDGNEIPLTMYGKIGEVVNTLYIEAVKKDPARFWAE